MCFISFKYISIKYTLYNKLYSTSDAGTYTLKHSGAAFLRNRDNYYPKGKITVSSSSSSQYQSITVNGPGIYTFNAYWKKSAVAGPTTPPTPATYTFKLRFLLSVLSGINFIPNSNKFSNAVRYELDTIEEIIFNLLDMGGDRYFVINGNDLITFNI